MSDDNNGDGTANGLAIGALVVAGCVLLAAATMTMIPVMGIITVLGGANDDTATSGCQNLPQAKMLSQTQLDNARLIHAAVSEVGADQRWAQGQTRRATVIALAVVMQESSLGTGAGWNRPNRDGDAGFYQQRTLPGWYGSLDQVNDPVQSTEWFLLGRTLTAADVAAAEEAGTSPAGPVGYTIPGLVHVPDWNTRPVTEAAWEVQRSATPEAYADHEDLARILLGMFDPAHGCSHTNAGTDTCPPTGLDVETGLTPDALLVLRCIHHSWPELTSFGGVGDRPAGVDRDHQEGRAVDVMIPGWTTETGKALGSEIAEWAVSNHTALGVRYVIWDAKIWSTTYPDKGWQTCGAGGHCYGGSNPTQAHRDHVHVSVFGTQAGATTATGKQGKTVAPLAHYRLSARFGQQGNSWASTHTGLDFAAPHGTPVRAVTAGTVIHAGIGLHSMWAGNYIQIEAAGEPGTVIWYAHLSTVQVAKGDRVTPRQQIGQVGNTGNSNGPHLHLEIRVNDWAVDPEPWLTQRGVALAN